VVADLALCHLERKVEALGVTEDFKEVMVGLEVITQVHQMLVMLAVVELLQVEITLLAEAEAAGEHLWQTLIRGGEAEEAVLVVLQERLLFMLLKGVQVC